MSGNNLSPFPVVNMPAPDESPKGTMTAEELTRISARAEAAINEAMSTIGEQQRRREERDAAQTADVVERRRLISEIRMMKRYRVNVAVDGLIGGVLITGAAFGLYHLGRWILEELRQPKLAPSLPAAKPSPDPATADQFTGSNA
jgi:hypothetical protein